MPEVIAAGEANAPIDFSIHLPMFTRQNLAEMPEYRRRFGTIGFKFFPGIKGADAGVMTALPHTGPMLGIDDPFVLDGMRGVAAIPGALTLYHAENPELNHAAAERVKAEGRADLRAWCDSRPDHGEAHSVRDGIWWQRLTGAPREVTDSIAGAADPRRVLRAMTRVAGALDDPKDLGRRMTERAVLGAALLAVADASRFLVDHLSRQPSDLVELEDPAAPPPPPTD